ncbi:MAG: hypothetical protein R3D71_07715 [Rickettsiales bacterium]
MNYIESRLGHADMPPSVNMLITLAAVAKGVEEYIEKHDIKSPEELHSRLEKDYNSVMLLHSTLPQYKIPKTRSESLTITKNSELAKEILGRKLHQSFVKKYKQHFLENKHRQNTNER